MANEPNVRSAAAANECEHGANFETWYVVAVRDA